MSVPREEASACKASRTASHRAVHDVEQPVVEAYGAMKPD